MLVDSTITLNGDGDDAHRGWELPAGWVPIVNRLHQSLVDLIREQEVVRVGNKMVALRYAIERPGELSTEADQAVGDLLLAVKAESLSTYPLRRTDKGITVFRRQPLSATSADARATGARSVGTAS